MKPDPCPCGSEMTCIVKSASFDPRGRWYVICQLCGRVGKHGRTEAQAVRRWNGLATLYTGERDERMKMDIVAGSHNDEFYTPKYAVAPIIKYIPTWSTVWCPFDTEDSEFVKCLRSAGCVVIPTHIATGVDFFQAVPPKCDFIVSNPPYSKKTEVLERLFDMGIPFAMLVGVVGLFESQRRFDMFKNHKFEIMYFNRRVSYNREPGDPRPTLNPPFSSVYVCHKMLPTQIVFEEINKT